LTQVFRQAAGSLIIANAHRVNRGGMPQTAPGQEETDFYWIEQPNPDKAVDMICRMVSERIPARFGFNAVNEVQVLAPMNRGTCGTENLNLVLGQYLNTESSEPVKFGERVFRKGDKVMQIANNYDKLIFNGDFGRIVHTDSEKRHLSVKFDGDRLIEYTPDELDQLALAYAVTIHKSQGSEFPAVIVPLMDQHYVMLQRNLLYTAMTRARKLLVLIGSRRALEMAVANIRQEPRWSLLSERLFDENLKKMA
jgi:exodeoxyribonuclease V alpha subunit